MTNRTFEFKTEFDNKGSFQKKNTEKRVKMDFWVGGYLTCFTFLNNFNKVKNFQLGGV